MLVSVVLFFVGLVLIMHNSNNVVMGVILMASGLLIGIIEQDRKNRGIK